MPTVSKTCSSGSSQKVVDAVAAGTAVGARKLQIDGGGVLQLLGLLELAESEESGGQGESPLVATAVVVVQQHQQQLNLSIKTRCAQCVLID